jgi:diguanylate cyclase (GGDEF)-like protein/PAS domain S-box-containing protein
MTVSEIREPIPSENFDPLLKLAAEICDMPIASITTCKGGSIQIQCCYGMNDARITVFCEHAIQGMGLMEVPDACADHRFKHAAEVAGPPYIRFYAGIPLISPAGTRFGTLAFMDTVPRTLDARQRERMHTVAHQIMVHFDLKQQRIKLERLADRLDQANAELSEQAEHLKQAQHIARVGSWKYLIEEDILRLSDEILYMFGITQAEFGGSLQAFLEMVHHEDRPAVVTAKDLALKAGHAEVRCRVIRPDGEARHFEIIAHLFKQDSEQYYLAGTTQDITERKAAEDKIRHLAYYDQLTGLPNRRLVLDRIDHLVALRQRMQRDGALLFIDLDNFKTLNDTHGHDKGDILLKIVAVRLQSCVRHYDCVGRFGGDEFVVLLEDIGDSPLDCATHALHVAQKVVSALNQPYDLGGLQHRSTPSIGIALIDGEATTTSELLKRADMAMYKAKSEGRNAIRFFSPQMQDAVNARAALETDLREMLATRAFVLHYQPQVDARGRLIGAEALLRCEHPRRGLVHPAEFIPIAEELGLIMEIGGWLMEEACRQLVKWGDNPATSELVLSINVSVRQFRHPDFVKQVTDTLAATGADPKKLKIEITESLLIKDMEETKRKMMDLKALGVRFSLDDFGTGYSSLAYLQRLPLDQLKIDQSFVQDVVNNQNDAAITRAIIALARNLGLSVIAEGVETKDQQMFLEREGCRNFQGFLYHRPLPAMMFDAVAAELQ